jgi:lysophospholipase L1-like esterase
MLLQKDGLHPNARGAREIAKRLRPLVIDMLRALEGSAPAGSQP